MTAYTDKEVVSLWLRLYNWLTGGTYQVESWPDDDSSQKNIDALCCDATGRTLAIEHTLIEPFARYKEDTDRFLKTLAVLENDPRLVQAGYLIRLMQSVGAIPTGIRWNEVPQMIVDQLGPVLSELPEGARTLTVSGGKWHLDLRVIKMATAVGDTGYFTTGRLDPGDAEPEIMQTALGKKIPKLAAAKADKKILLLERDAVSGSVEEQFYQLPRTGQIQSLLDSIDEVWTVDTAVLESEQVVFANQLHPLLADNGHYCSLELTTDIFWRVSR